MRELTQKHEIQEIKAQAWSPHPKGVKKCQLQEASVLNLLLGLVSLKSIGRAYSFHLFHYAHYV